MITRRFSSSPVSTFPPSPLCRLRDAPDLFLAMEAHFALLQRMLQLGKSGSIDVVRRVLGDFDPLIVCLFYWLHGHT
jgi:hypothetical protein